VIIVVVVIVIITGIVVIMMVEFRGRWVVARVFSGLELGSGGMSVPEVFRELRSAREVYFGTR